MEDKKSLFIFIGIGVCALIVVAVGFFWFLPSDSMANMGLSNKKTATASFDEHDPVEWVRQDGTYPGIEDKEDATNKEFVVDSEEIVKKNQEGIKESEDQQNDSNEETNIKPDQTEEGDQSIEETANVSVTNRIINTVSSNEKTEEQKPVNNQNYTEQTINKPQVVIVQVEKEKPAVSQPQTKNTSVSVIEKPVQKIEPAPQVRSTPAPTVNNTVQTSTRTVTSRPVQNQSKPTQNRVASAAKTTSIVTEYWIQIGSFSSLSKANGVKENLKKNGAASMISTKEVNGDNFYRVRIGPYSNNNEAKKFLSWIKELEGFNDSYISEVYVKK